MLAIFLETLPFFALIALGYGAGRMRFFTAEATAWLTKFVFYFALSAMLFRFAAQLSFSQFLNGPFLLAYLSGCLVVYGLATAVALWRGVGMAQAAVEAQCAVIGNTGFLGVPMLVMLMGEGAVLPLVMVLAIDLLVFSTLIVILITASREGRIRPSTLLRVLRGLLANPMIVSIALGLAWSAAGWAMPGPMEEFLTLLGNAATPGALFAIGASLAGKSAERVSVASWLSVCKLLLHPAAVAVFALWVFPVERYLAGIMISAAALPVAGNVFMLAQHYGVAPARASAAILFSTAASIVTLPAVIAWVSAR
ncbi:malate transporter [Roseovarius sp. 22II1-1F6A]|nr:malate transporter [Roseovarius sp. 22II1-1F6A]